MKKLLLILLVLPLFVKGQTVTTFAGGGASAPIGIPATMASVPGAMGGVFDSHGNYYFVGYSTVPQVYKIDASGIITIIAGTSTAGYNGDGGRADTAKLNQPYAVIVDSLDNVYIADCGNNRIRKIDVATGIISTVAGNGILGFSGDNGLATLASLWHPANMCFDRRGNLYIADCGNYRIRVINNLGIITTYAGNGTLGTAGDGGPATAAQIGAYGLCIDDSENLYFSASQKDVFRIGKINGLTHIVTTIAGTDTGSVYNGDSISALTANITPTTIRFDNIFKNLYLTDYINNRIRKIDVNGIIKTVVGSGIKGFGGDGGDATAAKLYYPSGLTFDSCGNLFFGDQFNDRIRKVEFNTDCLTESLRIVGLTSSSGNLYPNPATHQITIRNSVKIMRIVIINLLGQTMYTHEYDSDEVQVDVADLPSGVYVIKINGVEVKKFVKQ